MDTNKMREQFIEWLKTQPHVLNVGFNESTGKFLLAEDETAWQASREAVVIELESHCCYDRPGDAYEVLQDCKAAIEAQGLKVAP